MKAIVKYGDLPGQVDFRDIPEPVSYTHLDVYKRQWKREAAERLSPTGVH